MSEDKTTNSMSGESTISVPASDNDLYNENCLTGIMVGRSSTHKCIWVTLEEDIEGIEKGQDVIIHITDKLEKQVMDYELGARLLFIMITFLLLMNSNNLPLIRLYCQSKIRIDMLSLQLFVIILAIWGIA